MASNRGRIEGVSTDGLSVKQAIMRRNMSRDLFLITCSNILKSDKAHSWERDFARRFKQIILNSKEKDFNYHDLAIKVKLSAHDINMRSSCEYEKND